MRRCLAAWVLALPLCAQDPPAAALPFLVGVHDVQVAVDAKALRDSGLLAARAPSPLLDLLAKVGQGSGLDVAQIERAVLVRETADPAPSKPAGIALLVLVGTESLQLPEATAAMPAVEVEGRPARALSAPWSSTPVLVELAKGLLVAGPRAEIAARLGASAARDVGAPAAWDLAPGELVRVRLPLARDAAAAMAPPSARRNASHAAAEARFSLRWVRAKGEQFVLASTVRGFEADHEAARCAAAFAATATALRGDATAKSLHAALARTRIDLRGKDVELEVELGEAPEVVALAEALLRFVGVPLPTAP